jgi:hypothetical protein
VSELLRTHIGAVVDSLASVDGLRTALRVLEGSGMVSREAREYLASTVNGTGNPGAAIR